MRQGKLRVCLAEGCPQLVRAPASRCPEHARAYDAAHRGDFRWVYQSPEWKRLRADVLERERYCRMPGCNTMATDVDHIVPLADGGAPFDRKNVQPLCKFHHSQKTAREVWHTKKAGD